MCEIKTMAELEAESSDGFVNADAKQPEASEIKTMAELELEAPQDFRNPD